MGSSDFNLQKIDTKKLADNIDATIEYGGNILIVGRRGSAKTAIAKDRIKASGLKLKYFNLSLMERPDIGGYPDFFGSKGNKYIKFLMAEIFRDLIEGDEECAVILDEVDKADDTLLAPLLEFIQFRTINGNKLKNLKAIVMTANLPSEGGKRPALPLLDRTEKFLVEMDPLHWLDWGAETGNLHPSISAYISENMEDLVGELSLSEDVFGDRSPRSWHMASDIVTFGEKKLWNANMLKDKVSGCVGKHAGAKYAAFFEHYSVLLPIVDSILEGKNVSELNSFEKNKKLVTIMMVSKKFSSYLDKLYNNKPIKSLSSEASKISENVVNFLEEQDPEQSLISIRSQIARNRMVQYSLIENPKWSNLLDQLIKKMSV